MTDAEMSKEAAAELLRKRGYVVTDDHGVPMIHLDVPFTKKQADAVARMLKDAGYSCSWGWRAGMADVSAPQADSTAEEDGMEDRPAMLTDDDLMAEALDAAMESLEDDGKDTFSGLSEDENGQLSFL